MFAKGSIGCVCVSVCVRADALQEKAASFTLGVMVEDLESSCFVVFFFFIKINLIVFVNMWTVRGECPCCVHGM